MTELDNIFALANDFFAKADALCEKIHKTNEILRLEPKKEGKEGA